MKITKQQLKQIIKEEISKILNENKGKFTYTIRDPVDEDSSEVDIQGIDKTFEEMIGELVGKEVNVDGEKFIVSLEPFGGTAEGLANAGHAGTYIELWAKMNGWTAERTGGYYQ